MALKVDFTQVPTFEPIPAGRYPATLTSWEVKDGANSPFPNLVTKFTINADAPNDAGGRVLTRYYTSNPDGLGFFRNDMIVLGQDPDYFKGPQAAEIDMEEVAQANVGNECYVEVVIEDYDGQKRNQIKRMRPISA